jgi:hypothetical protein
MDETHQNANISEYSEITEDSSVILQADGSDQTFAKMINDKEAFRQSLKKHGMLPKMRA